MHFCKPIVHYIFLRRRLILILSLFCFVAMEFYAIFCSEGTSSDSPTIHHKIVNITIQHLSTCGTIFDTFIAKHHTAYCMPSIEPLNKSHDLFSKDLFFKKRRKNALPQMNAPSDLLVLIVVKYNTYCVSIIKPSLS